MANMNLMLTDKERGLVRFAIQILLDDETTEQSDRGSLEAVAKRLDR